MIHQAGLSDTGVSDKRGKLASDILFYLIYSVSGAVIHIEYFKSAITINQSKIFTVTYVLLCYHNNRLYMLTFKYGYQLVRYKCVRYRVNSRCYKQCTVKVCKRRADYMIFALLNLCDKRNGIFLYAYNYIIACAWRYFFFSEYSPCITT